MTSDFEEQQARHQRRLALMRMQGDLNRQSSRLVVYWTIAAVLGFIALLMLAAS